MYAEYIFRTFQKKEQKTKEKQNQKWNKTMLIENGYVEIKFQTYNAKLLRFFFKIILS